MMYRTANQSFGSLGCILQKHFTFLVMIFLGTYACYPPSVLAQEDTRKIVGVVIVAEGLGPSILRPGATSLEILKPGDKVRVGDKVYSGIDGVVQINFLGVASQAIRMANRAILSIGEVQSTLVYDESQPPVPFPTPKGYIPINLKLYSGRLKVKEKISEPPLRFDYIPNPCVIGVRGTHVINCDGEQFTSADSILEWISEYKPEDGTGTFGVLQGPRWHLDGLDLGAMDDVYFMDSIHDFEHLKWYWGLIASYRGEVPFTLASGTTPTTDPVWVNPGEFYKLEGFDQFLLSDLTQELMDLSSQPYSFVPAPSGQEYDSMYLLGSGSEATYFPLNVDEPTTRWLLLLGAALLALSRVTRAQWAQQQLKVPGSN